MFSFAHDVYWYLTYFSVIYFSLNIVVLKGKGKNKFSQNTKFKASKNAKFKASQNLEENWRSLIAIKRWIKLSI